MSQTQIFFFFLVLDKSSSSSSFSSSFPFYSSDLTNFILPPPDFILSFILTGFDWFDRCSTDVLDVLVLLLKAL